MARIAQSLATGLYLIALVAIASPAVAQQSAPTNMSEALAQLDPDRPETVAAARVVFERLAAEGDMEAVNGLGMLLTFSGNAEDEQRAMTLFEQAADGGSDAALLNLGVRLLGNDDEADDARGVSLLEAITDERVIVNAVWPLAQAHMFGTGVPQDMDRGFPYLRRTIDADPANIGAQYLIGRAYEEGWGVPSNAALAYRHMKMAADGGGARAQWIAGMMLLEGRGVRADAAQARSYVRRSAEQGEVDGMISLAVMLALGEGGAVDEVNARTWYRRAAEAGSAHALRGLSFMLINGDGGPADMVTGAAYLDMAAKAGDENAVGLWPRLADFARENRNAIETVKAAWMRDYGPPR